MQSLKADVCIGHDDPVHVVHQGLQPYVNVGDYHDYPFPRVQDSGSFGIDMGVDHDLSVLFQARVGMSHAHADHVEGGGSADENVDITQPELYAAMTAENSSDTGGWQMYEQESNLGQEVGGALPLRSTEQLGQPRLADCGTPPLLTTMDQQSMPDDGVTRSAFLGGGKTDDDDYFILEDDERTNAEITAPGHLQDRLIALQGKALDAIQALPAKCREDQDYGMVETRVWGLQALKHILRMRLALQGSIQLTRPITPVIDMPQTNELLAANLTLTIRNKGNRCFANSVLRRWCWLGAHHDNPAEFWGPSRNLCLQLLQQDDIPDIFWASELQPVIAKLDNPQAQHDASEFLVLLWELWGQTGLQGNWHSYFGGRWSYAGRSGG